MGFCVCVCVCVVFFRHSEGSAFVAQLGGHLFNEVVALVEFMYFVFTRMPGESYRRRLRSLLLYLC